MICQATEYSAGKIFWEFIVVGFFNDFIGKRRVGDDIDNIFELTTVGLPRGMVNRTGFDTQHQLGKDEWSSIVQTELEKDPIFEITLSSNVSNGNGTISITAEALTNINLDKKEKIEYQRGGTYVVMEGPQFSTLAESNLYRSWNADVIGMTNMPEAKLAREAEIRYASVSMVTDFDCWHPDHENVDVQQVIKVLLGNAEKAKKMIKSIINNFESHIDPKDPTNNCLDVAIITAPEKRTQKTIDKLKTVAGRALSK